MDITTRLFNEPSQRRVPDFPLGYSAQPRKDADFPAPQSLPGARKTEGLVGQKDPANELPLPQTFPGAKSKETPVAKNDNQLPSEPQARLAEADKKRYEQIFNASKNFFKDVYAVSDSTFTIFKDSSGQYITRYTSLRDGKVTYFPEPQLLKHLSNTQQVESGLVQLKV